MIFIGLLIGALAAAVPVAAVAASVTALKLETQVVKGDWEEILKRGTIRVAVPYSRTLFFNDRGNQMGLTAEIIREFEQWLKKKYPKRSRPITVLAIPTTRDKLFGKLRNGYAEIAAGNLTITAE
ncbi:MAG TPA: lytic transglycosylase F, partial [Candidatus Binatia bacterium]